MSELKQLVNMKPIEGITVIDYPGGAGYGYVGKVPTEIYYDDDATPELIARGASFGGRFGPKTRSFKTCKAAVDFAKLKGYEVKVSLSNKVKET